MTRRAEPATGALRTTDLLVLAVLADGPQHGYALAQAIGARTRQMIAIRPGDLYRVLYRLHDTGLVEQVPEAARPPGDERRAYYRLTPAGRKAARDQARLLAEVCAPLFAPARGARGPA
jgi:DNA-binding PadR family transcriptional regulator